MPRLPDKTSIQTRTDFSTPAVHAPDTSAAFKGIERLGRGLEAQGEAMTKADQGMDLIRADSDTDAQIRALERKYDTDTDHATYETRFGAESNQILLDSAKTIREPAMREKWMLSRGQAKQQQALDRVMTRGIGLARQEKEVELGNRLDTYRGAYAETEDPERRRQILTDMDAVVRVGEATGLIPPKVAERFRENFIDESVKSDAERRIDSGEAEGVLKDFGLLPGGGKTRSKVSGSWQIFDKDTPTAAQRRDIFAKGGVVVNLDTNWTQSGRATEPMVVIPDNATSEQRRAAEAYAAGIAEIYNAKFGTSMKPKVLTRSQNGRGRNDTIHTEPFSVTDSRAVQFFTSDEGRAQHAQLLRDTLGTIPGVAFSLPHDPTRKGDKGAHGPHGNEVDFARPLLAELSGGGRPRPVPVPGGPADQMADDDDGTGLMPWGEVTEIEQDSPTRAQYRMLSGKQRGALITKARTALSAKTQAEVASDIERIERGEEEITDENGETAFQRSMRLLTPNQREKYAQRRDQAVLLRDNVRALKFMHEDDVQDHIARIGEGAPENRRVIVEKVRQRATDEWKKISEARRSDPAAAVASHPTVENAQRLAQSAMTVGIGVADNGDLVIDTQKVPRDVAEHLARQEVEARLDAQDAVGIPRSLQRRISKRQAQRLINLADANLLSDDQLRDGLAKAAATAASIYGPEMGQDVFNDALALAYKGGRQEMAQYRRMGENGIEDSMKASARAQILAKSHFGKPITRGDMANLSAKEAWLDRIATAPSLLEGPGSSRPYLSDPYQRSQLPAPTSQQIKVLIDAVMTRPKQAAEWRKQFDQRFGDGAALNALERLMSDEPPSP